MTGVRRGGDLVVLIEVGVRRPARTLCPLRRGRGPLLTSAGQGLEENVGAAARGGKRARDVGASVGVRPRGPSV